MEYINEAEARRLLGRLIDEFFPGVDKEVEIEEEELPTSFIDFLAEILLKLTRVPVNDVRVYVPVGFLEGSDYAVLNVNRYTGSEAPSIDIFFIPNSGVSIAVFGPRIPLTVVSSGKIGLPYPFPHVLNAPLPNVMYSVPPGMENIAVKKLGINLNLVNEVINTVQEIQPDTLFVSPMLGVNVGVFNVKPVKINEDLVMFTPPVKTRHYWVYDYYDYHELPYVATSLSRPYRAYYVEEMFGLPRYTVTVNILRDITKWGVEEPRMNKYTVSVEDGETVVNPVLEEETGKDIVDKVYRDIETLISTINEARQSST